jgi:hypothetical protein
MPRFIRQSRNASCSVASAPFGSRVSVTPDTPLIGTGQYRNAIVDAAGHFTLQGLPPGSYHVYAWKTFDLLRLSDPDYLKPYAAQSVGVEVKTGAVQAIPTPLEAQ